MKDKTDRLLDALEHPENYTDAELEQILADPEARGVYDMLRKTADASMPVPEINLDEEWQRFEAKHPGRKLFILHWLPILATRKAAAVVLALVGTLAVVAVTIGMTHYIGSRSEMVQTGQPEPQKQTVIAKTEVAPADTVPTGLATVPETILFKGENLETILAEIARYYGVSVKFNRYDVKSLELYFEWNRALPLNELVEQLNNFEQIDIAISDSVLTVK